MLAFENFLLLMLVIFALQVVDRSFGPVLLLHVTQLSTRRGARRCSLACCFRRSPWLPSLAINSPR